MTRLLAFVAATAVLLTAHTLHAADPAVICESGKLKVAGKYSACLLGAESKAVKTSASPDYSKCIEKFSIKWLSTEEKGAGMCPGGDGDQNAIQDFLDACSISVAGALDGDTLPADVVTCNADLTTCTSDLSTCNANHAMCTGDLSTCNSNYTACSNGLALCTAGTALASDVLAGETFSSAAGLGVAGTMANVGQQNVLPGTSPVAIAQGYHDGTGTVAGDPDLVAANIASGADIFGVAGTAVPANTVKTGQTTAYTADKNDGVAGAVSVPDDGSLQRGTPLGYVDNGDGTVTDLSTGLMWEKKGDNGGLHDKDNVYRWRGNGSQETIWDWLDDVNAEGGTGFAGYSDWRIPNAKELVSIVDYQTSPSINPVFNTGCAGGCSFLTCSCTQPGVYWSSTTFILNPANSAWRIGFDAGGIIAGDKATFLDYVRAVRGGS